MSDHEWDSMGETDFDSTLKDCFPDLPPFDIVRDVTPWRRAMNRILFGFALNLITLNFLNLNVILPAIGLILTLLGFRILRRENNWFKACWITTIIRSAYFFTILILNATIYQSTAYASPLFHVLTGINLAIAFSQFFCLWRGIKVVQEKAGLPPHAGGAVALMVWYLLICLLAFLHYIDLIILIVLILICIFIIRSLFKLSKELDEAGYVIRAAPVLVSNRVLVTTILATLAIGISFGYLFFNSYTMEWTASEPNEQTELQDIKANLIELGFPEEILQDLTTEDIKACEGALEVVVKANDHPANNGRKVIKTIGNTQHHNVVYDKKELRITSIAVKLSGDWAEWKLFHHFLWVINPGFYGTEGMQIFPANRFLNSWLQVGDISGQVLHTIDGQNYTAPYHSLGYETYTSGDIFCGKRTSTDIFATFSMPEQGEKHRGYVSYAITAVSGVCIIDSCIDYTHQQTWLQYPALTAMEHRMINSWNSAGAFLTIQDWLQFYPDE